MRFASFVLAALVCGLLAAVAERVSPTDSCQPSPHGVICHDKDGVPVYFDLERLTGYPRSFAKKDYATWEPESFAIFKRFVRHDSIVLDVGAWIGPTCLWFAHVAKSVIALEPTAAAHKMLQANLAANVRMGLRESALEVVNAGMSDTVMTAQMSNRGDSTDRISLSSQPQQAGVKGGERAQSVQLTTVEQLETLHPVLKGVTFVKVDTEGFERHIIPAMTNWLSRRRPVIYLSLHPMFTSKVHLAASAMRATFPFLWEADMRTPYRYRHHVATNFSEDAAMGMLGTWVDITKAVWAPPPPPAHVDVQPLPSPSAAPAARPSMFRSFFG